MDLQTSHPEAFIWFCHLFRFTEAGRWLLCLVVVLKNFEVIWKWCSVYGWSRIRFVVSTQFSSKAFWAAWVESVPAGATLVRNPQDDCRICFASESMQGNIRMLKKGKLKQNFSPSSKTHIFRTETHILKLCIFREFIGNPWKRPV